LSEKCLNLKPGQTLEAFVATQFSELRLQIGALEEKRSQVAANLRQARESERYSATLDALRRRGEELKKEGQDFAAQRGELSKQAAGLAELERLLSAAEKALLQLADPRSRTRYLENEIAREAELLEKQRQIDSSLERLNSERRLLVEELETEKFSLPNGVYDPSQHSEQRASLIEGEKKLAEMRATLAAAQARKDQLAAELARFAEIRQVMRGELRERERLETVGEVTAFIRDTLKEAAPRVARNYVRHVSLEAARMFRDIIGDDEKTLRWNDDYAITLEQEGFERPFASLSGGEQMAAALAVRLALLQQLSDIRIAFFDEPTANMDAERRENFAVQFGRITHFDQLFVISHDDTFDQYVDNVISLGSRG
jgi:exonuclease SbcC